MGKPHTERQAAAEQRRAGWPWPARCRQACPVPGAPEARGRGGSRARQTWTGHPVNRRSRVVPGPVSTELGPSGKESRKLIGQGVRTTRTRHTEAPKGAQVDRVTLQTTNRPASDHSAVCTLSLTPRPGTALERQPPALHLCLQTSHPLPDAPLFISHALCKPPPPAGRPLNGSATLPSAQARFSIRLSHSHTQSLRKSYCFHLQNTSQSDPVPPPPRLPHWAEPPASPPRL